MTKRFILVGVLLATTHAVAFAAEGKVLCLKKSLTGPLRVRESCKPKEQQLGSFEAVRALLAALSVENGGATLRLTGLNVQIVSGSGATDGQVNGRGNFIVGYDEAIMTGHCSVSGAVCERDSDCSPTQTCQSIAPVSAKTGSHNVVLGPLHTYNSFGGFVAGRANEVTGPFASVAGGVGNLAGVGFPVALPPGSLRGSVGEGNSVGGGILNIANGLGASVTGGEANIASGEGAAVTGGFGNRVTGDFAAVSGGISNLASANSASVCGGAGNVAGPGASMYSEFADHERNGQAPTVTGGAINVANGAAASVSGGKNNVASGDFSSVSGGTVPEVTGMDEWHAAITSGFPTATEY